MYGLKKVHQRHDDNLSPVTWREFERLLAAHYRERGYRVEHVGGGRDTVLSRQVFDGGIDLKLWRAEECAVVQCKHWNRRQVSHNVVHELLGVMLAERANAAIVVTSGEFTAAARAVAARHPALQLIDGQLLRQMLGPLPILAFDGTGATDDLLHGVDPDTGFLRLGGRRARPRRGESSARAVIALLIALTVIALAHVLIHARFDAVVRRPLTPLPAQDAPAQWVTLAPPTAPRVDATLADAHELRDGERRNVVAMKISEKSTPELAH